MARYPRTRYPRKRDLMPEPVTPPTCPYCGNSATLGPHPYAERFGPVWSCPSLECGARVGTKDDHRTPLGSLANESLRTARRRAHLALDTLWKVEPKRSRCATLGVRRERPAMKRWEAYAWLSEQMGLPAELTHIAHFDESQCVRVIELLTERDGGT